MENILYVAMWIKKDDGFKFKDEVKEFIKEYKLDCEGFLDEMDGYKVAGKINRLYQVKNFIG